jgi:hypothetical protein
MDGVRLTIKLISTLIVFACLCPIVAVIWGIYLIATFIAKFGWFALGDFPAYARADFDEKWVIVVLIMLVLTVPIRLVMKLTGDGDDD